MNGTYFWSSNMVLIDLVSRERIVEVINYIIQNNELNSVFARCSNVENENDHLYPEGFFVQKI
ncbi:hypothetical protein [Lysinibacillus sp. SGAir0095]|uniref:hypothetical protein n=1 Tax=Lysinibacillus sp. SGAir0095 TaxID=2070463 RepID=UPI0010CD552A|nr:hypothetical protein [Lysinibacillus sp. SGAir0095]QCR31928.1 hypothetical protein C1N55_06940 [Lysinibacillus sp. SGAir0095]